MTKELNDTLLSVDSPIDSWILDSGASIHMTANHELFENYIAGNYGNIFLADGTSLEIVCTGDVLLKMSNGCIWKIQGMYQD